MRSQEVPHGGRPASRRGGRVAAAALAQVLLIGTTGAAHAQATARLDMSYSDELLPATPIGRAEVVVGVMREQVAGSGEQGLVMEVPTSWPSGAPVCVRATSADGRYSGEGSAMLPSEPAPLLELRLRSGYPTEFAEGVKAGRFIVRVDRATCAEASTGRSRAADSEDEDDPAVAVAQWLGSPEGAALLVYVDSGAAKRVTARLEGADRRLTDVIDCTAEDSGQSYDHICRIALDGVPPEEATLVVERIRNGGRDDPARLSLDLRRRQ